MNKTIIMIFASLNLLTACAQIKNDTTMIERYNFEAVEGKSNGVSIQKGEWLIDIYAPPGYSQWEYAPAHDFYMIKKEYYENGIIKSKREYLGGVSIGFTKNYDEEGNLIKIVDEDEKFGRIKPRDLVDIMEEIGWINRKTGEAIMIKEPLPTDGNYYKTLFYLLANKNLTINFSSEYYDEKEKKTHPPVWGIGYMEGATLIQYHVDGNTGKYQKHETQLNLIE